MTNKQAPTNLRFAVMATDVVVFAVIEGVLHALVAPANPDTPYKGQLAFLGGIIKSDETAHEAAVRILKEKGALQQVYLEQLFTFSEVKRDRRNRVVSVAYMGLVQPDTAAVYEHRTARFVPVRDLSGLAYDHDDMLAVAQARLGGKLSYTTIAQFLLPAHFTLSELQAVYETILKSTVDKRNFRKKILALDIIADTGRVQEGVKNRPAALYKFKSNQLTELPLIV